jgi:hypothetical protein
MRKLENTVKNYRILFKKIYGLQDCRYRPTIEQSRI